MSPAPSRRSKRIAEAKTKDDAKHKAKAAPNLKKRVRQASPDADAGATREPSPQRKARKRTKAGAAVESSDQAPQPRRGRGKLSQLTEINLDVLFEIFSYLEPLDLLRMSRTTKDLRALLMKKETAFVWESARLGMDGLPPMIEGLNEPQYANLLFDNHCHNCLKTPTKYIVWEIRMRLCKECLEKGTIVATSRQLRAHGLTDSFKAQELLKNITPYRCFKPSTTYYIAYYDVRTYERLVEESAPLQHGFPQYAAWFAKKQEDYKALVKSCQQYEDWATSRTETRAAELDSLRRLRLESIIARLTADGWDEELQLDSTLETLQRHPLVKQPRELTNRIWNTIKPALTALMTEFRAELLERKIQTAIYERTRTLSRLGQAIFAALPETPHHPPASALCTYQPFLDIIKNTPPDEDATTKLEEALDSETVLAISAEWREEQEKRLTAMLRSKTGCSADLSLDVNAFACVVCGPWVGFSDVSSVLHYPHFASHSCFHSTVPIGETNVRVWTGDGMIKTLEQDVYTRCQGFVRMCGLDPDTATAEDMDGAESADVFFRCEDACHARQEPMYGMKVFRLMRWRTAMNHNHFRGKFLVLMTPSLSPWGVRRKKPCWKTT
ncbi:hypothetical protein BDZ89DRAFT_621684 [Hymenopellis radicata]|nr:hypothetical protein BDZ89DRAFT_621684 [Hymenopellis radicata]